MGLWSGQKCKYIFEFLRTYLNGIITFEFLGTSLNGIILNYFHTFSKFLDFQMNIFLWGGDAILIYLSAESRKMVLIDLLFFVTFFVWFSCHIMMSPLAGTLRVFFFQNEINEPLYLEIKASKSD